MLRATTEDQRLHVEEVLKAHQTYYQWPLDFEKETDCGYEVRIDAIYIDGAISFDTFAEIVDYLRSCNPDEN